MFSFLCPEHVFFPPDLFIFSSTLHLFFLKHIDKGHIFVSVFINRLVNHNNINLKILSITTLCSLLFNVLVLEGQSGFSDI